MGLTNAPSIFSHVMNGVFKGLIGKSVLIYLDDILVFSKTEEEHVKHVREVLEILRQQKLYAKLAKCDFGKSELTFLGHVVGAEGVKVDPKKIEVVKEWPDPRDVHNVRQFLGLTNYFRKFIQGYAVICRPISALLCKGEDFAWTTECKIAFQAL